MKDHELHQRKPRKLARRSGNTWPGEKGRTGKAQRRHTGAPPVGLGTSTGRQHSQGKKEAEHLSGQPKGSSCESRPGAV